ncbi:MAG: hypothetical protein L6R35_006484 [Caloplaca aegaea]|nr:MAG: hypothetical protein L6R35_006484 [Caloplaca aegaea]
MFGSAFLKKDGRYLDLASHMVLNETHIEFKRLLQHPRLLPDRYAQLFLDDTEMRLRNVLSHMQQRHAANQSQQLKLQERIIQYRKEILPDYDESRTTWQQFLHNQAPGSGIARDQIPFRHGCTQMITAACSLMSANRSDEHENFAHELEVRYVAGRREHEGYKRTVRFYGAKTLAGNASGNVKAGQKIQKQKIMADVLPHWLNSLNSYQPAIVQSATSTFEPPLITQNRENQRNMVKTHGHGHAGIAKAKKPMATVKPAKGKNTRPLNSFMGFRCYYSVLFEDFEQKIISSYIVFLWERDPCKAKWALAAKAYSIIRDQVGKQQAPLDVFLMLVANFLGIVEPQQYLAVMGWEISVDGIGTISLVKNDAMVIDSNILSTNVSVEDIIAFASQHGFIGAMDSMISNPSHKPVMAMAAAAQPLSGKPLEKTGKDNQVQPKGIAASGPSQGSTEIKNEEATAVTHQLTSLLPLTQNNAAAINPQAPARASVPLAAATVVSHSTNPFDIDNILDFDPEADLPIWDPSTGDAWDAFDISAWIHEDAYIN